jgi:hypothetical protein
VFSNKEGSRAFFMIVNHIVYVTLFILPTVIIAAAINSQFNQILHAHDFSTTDESLLVTLVEQIKTETQLVSTNFLSNENASAMEHARSAAKLMKDLDDNMTQAKPSSDITQIYDNGQRNSTTFALVVANIVDEILRKYASAFDIGYDLTNMSNMGTTMMNMTTMMMAMPIGNNSSSPSMSMAMSSDTNHSNMFREDLNSSAATENNLVLVEKYDYETAQVLSDNIDKEFSSQLRPRSPVNETANLDILENGLQELKQAVNRKATPEDLMNIVHIQIHPRLQNVYDLKLSRSVVASSPD